MDDEKRRFARIPFRVKAEMTINNRAYSAETINNLSVGGCLLPIEVDVDTGAKCRLKIFLSGTNSELFVQVAGKVIRCEPGAVAIKFTEIEPDSLFHLHNIVRFNFPDTDQVEQEIRDHPGLK